MRRVRKPMDPKKAMILATIAVLGMAAAFIVVAVTHLIRPATDFSQAFDGGLSKGERYKGKVYAASSEFYYIEHTINHVIPTGTEHFYLVFDKSYRDIVIVRAPKDFMENFDSGGTNKEGCEIEGFVRESEHDMAERAFDVMVNINGSYESESLRSSFITVFYIDLMGTRIYTLMLIDGVLTAACYFWIFFLLKYKDRDEKGVVKMSKLHGAALVVTMLAALVMMIYIFSFI